MDTIVDNQPDDKANTHVIDYLVIRDGQSGIVFCNLIGTKSNTPENLRNEDDTTAED